MRIAFALSFDDPAAAREAADTLEERGFDVKAGDPLTATTDVRDADELNDLRDELRTLAGELGGEFLGNGSFVLL